ncbi:HWE histidine kinase domain-containing protein [Sinorhizobium sp. M4_45]|uniref:HWE histidine kinase domain-containing protein n=1 Tax=Sinorhizobium TaxID=28105 RepID=UPI001FDF489B|nr:HWE histidine kinase domain-containing protein [Sinorhizobium sp. M4_45]
MLVSAHRLFHPDNNSRTLLLSIVDATERRQLEAEKNVLLGELRHRMKNLLGLVRAIARQTKASDRTGEDTATRFNALVQAHDAAYSQEGRPTTKRCFSERSSPIQKDRSEFSSSRGRAYRLRRSKSCR